MNTPFVLPDMSTTCTCQTSSWTNHHKSTHRYAGIRSIASHVLHPQIYRAQFGWWWAMLFEWHKTSGRRMSQLWINRTHCSVQEELLSRRVERRGRVLRPNYTYSFDPSKINGGMVVERRGRTHFNNGCGVLEYWQLASCHNSKGYWSNPPGVETNRAATRELVGWYLRWSEWCGWTMGAAQQR